jgi:hypothetical protein
VKLNLYLIGGTLVAALGGLLFGFDTAVISGTTDALTKVFHFEGSVLGFEGVWLGLTVLTCVRRHESMVRVLRRMVLRIREISLENSRLLLDRAFFNGAVVAFLQEERLPFMMPVVIRGRAPRKGTKPTGLRWINHQPAGWYPHAMKHEKQPLQISICVGYRRHRNRKDGKHRHQKLLFAAWRVRGSPTAIREMYRLRLTH